MKRLLIPLEGRIVGARLREAAARYDERADGGTAQGHSAGAVVKSINALLIVRLADEREIHGLIVLTPGGGEFRASARAGNPVYGEPWLGDGLPDHVIPIGADSRGGDDGLRRLPLILSVAAGLRVREMECRRSAECGLIGKGSIGAHELDCAAAGLLREVERIPIPARRKSVLAKEFERSTGYPAD